MICPKCSATCVRTHAAKWIGEHVPIFHDERGRSYPASPFDGPARVFDTRFTELWSCPTHGEFGVKADGQAEFVHPDAWVVGPNGEKLFRL